MKNDEVNPGSGLLALDMVPLKIEILIDPVTHAQTVGVPLGWKPEDAALVLSQVITGLLSEALTKNKEQSRLIVVSAGRANDR